MHLDLATLEPIHVGPTNCFVIDTGDGLLLIDTGINADQFWHTLVDGLHARGYQPTDVKWVLLTHAHNDHCGLASRMKDASGAQVLIHQQEVQFLRQGGMHARVNRDLYVQLFLQHGTPHEVVDWFLRANDAGWARDWRTEPRIFDPGPDYRVRTELIGEVEPPTDRADRWEGAPMEPDTVFGDGELLAFGEVQLQALHTPGHTPGHCSFYHEASQVMFTGDHVLRRITPNPGLFFIDNDITNRTRSVPDFMRSLGRLRAFTARRVFGAHEGAMDDLQAALDRLMNHHEDRAAAALRAVQGARDTTFLVMPFLFPNLRRNGLFAAMGETLGHLDLLEDRAQVAAGEADGLIRYQPV